MFVHDGTSSTAHWDLEIFLKLDEKSTKTPADLPSDEGRECPPDTRQGPLPSLLTSVVCGPSLLQQGAK